MSLPDQPLIPQEAVAESEGRLAPSPWPCRLAAFGAGWGAFVVTGSAIIEPTPNNLAILIATALSGLYTFALYAARRFWLPLLARRPLRNATLLGIFNAALIEGIFLLIEHLMGAQGVAAHPNLLIDLLLTMPWYTLMVITFVRVQHRRRFDLGIVLLLGAVYETGADGIVGSAAGLAFGDFQLLTPAYWLQLGLMFFWAFIPVYSAMVLPPALLVNAAPLPDDPPSAVPAWLDALRPLLWLAPFVAYLLIVILILSAFNPS